MTKWQIAWWVTLWWKRQKQRLQPPGARNHLAFCLSAASYNPRLGSRSVHEGKRWLENAAPVDCIFLDGCNTLWWTLDFHQLPAQKDPARLQICSFRTELAQCCKFFVVCIDIVERPRPFCCLSASNPIPVVQTRKSDLLCKISSCVSVFVWLCALGSGKVIRATLTEQKLELQEHTTCTDALRN